MALLIHRKVARGGAGDLMENQKAFLSEQCVEGTYGKWKESGKLQLLQGIVMAVAREKINKCIFLPGHEGQITPNLNFFAK